MRIEGLQAEADLVGRRVRIGWDAVPDQDTNEDVADIPPLRLRAKLRDYEFPTPDASFVVYDSQAFPPGNSALAAEVERAPARDAGQITEQVIESVSTTVADPEDRTVEALRRTRWTTRNSEGKLLRRREEILDIGGGLGLPAGRPRYYELVQPGRANWKLRTVVTPTEAYRDPTARRLYDLVPSVYRRHDVIGPVSSNGSLVGAIPETATAGGQLRRFLDPIGLAADQLRSRADQLRDLHDVATGDARYLPHLAATLGWDLDHTADIPGQRHEIRFASTLYRLTGTLLGCKLWVKRLTGWDAEIVEFWRNVFFSNDLGSGRAVDKGSRTVNTADAALLAGMGGVDDQVDYIHDSRTGQGARYALNAIGIFVTPSIEELSDYQLLASRRDRLLANTALFLPLNLRAVVVIEEPTLLSESESVLGLTSSTTDTLPPDPALPP